MNLTTVADLCQIGAVRTYQTTKRAPMLVRIVSATIDSQGRLSVSVCPADDEPNVRNVFSVHPRSLSTEGA